MKKHVIQFLTLCLVTTFTFSFSVGQTIPGIHLGRLEFVRPPERLSNDMRKLKVTMSKTEGITSKFASKVGGVAFVQVAQPSFKIESFSLQCDTIKNSAFAIINGQRYELPLETWQLMPIVSYANSEYDAAVSLFGRRLFQDHGHTDTIRTLFHNAFIDNLLGLRLLQTDLLLAGNYLQNEDDRGKLPTFDGLETPILAESEKMLYNPHVFVASSLNASINIELGEYYNSYVFTDFVDSVTGDSIKFNVEDVCLKIEGHPYYYFIDKQIDTMATLLNLFKTIDNNKKPTHKIIKLTELTNDLREKHELVRDLNPIVYDAAVTTCQWTAFFRYAKENYPQNWDSFVKQVGNLQYDAPEVYTPIKLKNR